MNMNPTDKTARPVRSTATTIGLLESSVTKAVSLMANCESIGMPVGLAAAGIDPRSMLVALLGSPDLGKLLERDTEALFPQAAKRKVEDDAADDDEEESDDDEVADDDDAEEEEDDLEDDDEEEDEEDDDDEEEEDDEFDDPDDDDDFDDDDDDEDDFDDDE